MSNNSLTEQWGCLFSASDLFWRVPQISRENVRVMREATVGGEEGGAPFHS